jgi:drug/metabolite transporter (DMT)-like permease
VALVAIRATLALPLFWAFALRRDGWTVIRSTPASAIAAAAAVGALCYYAGALLDFMALTMIDASIERVLIFSYPAMVVLFTALRDRQPPPRRVLAAAALTYLGIFFTMGGFDLTELRANLFGAVLVLGSALSYAVYFLVSEKYTRELGSPRFTLFAMTAAAACLIPHFIFTRDAAAELAAITPAAWLLLALISVLCMFLPALLQAEGVRRIGAQRGAVLSTVGPPTTVLLAWALLGERLGGWQWLGIALIVGGILALDLARAAGHPKRVDEPAA